MNRYIIILFLGLVACECKAQAWLAVGTGIKSQKINAYNNIYALTIYKDELYAGGSFTEAGGINTNFIAKWDGTKWSGFGMGLNGTISSLCVYGDDLYAAGWFTTVDGVEAHCIAKWDGTSWSAVGGGMDFHPNSLIVYKNELYAAGEFTMAGGKPANNIAKWNGTNWTTLGKGVDVVSRLGIFKGELCTGGYAFTRKNGFNKWNGSAWTKPGYDLHGVPYSMTIYKDDLYVGGYFPATKKMPETCLFKWDGKSWSNVGQKGPNGHVYSLLVYEDELYATGFFNMVEDIPAENIAKWNGSKWAILSPGVNFHPQAMIIYNDYFYVAGGYSSSESDIIGKEMIMRIPTSEMKMFRK